MMFLISLLGWDAVRLVGVDRWRKFDGWEA